MCCTLILVYVLFVVTFLFLMLARVVSAPLLRTAAGCTALLPLLCSLSFFQCHRRNGEATARTHRSSDDGLQEGSAGRGS